ncbi:response regulator [Paeniroseomonas aquatica]|uniref:Response regulator n=1 Tax=Paeniroseomonas aquatica TaxID=373043 RepID=A0ABT8AGG2_9PROT|nr:response regulator [Paeniroseomonas aquatica]MDN3568830.1 response regulator [Paeniroseomonas aquatica]
MTLGDQVPVQASEEPSRKPLVLVIEDEVLIAMLMEQILIDAGYAVVAAFTGEEALSKATSIDRISLVVTDLRLAYGIDGRSVLRELRANCPSLPAVVVTGFGQWLHEADLRGVGGPTARLMKPFVAEELVACVAGLLSDPAARPDRRDRRSRASDPRDASP